MKQPRKRTPRKPLVTLRKGHRLTLHLAIQFPRAKPYMSRILTWEGLELVRAETAFFAQGHVLGWLSDLRSGAFGCSLDHRSLLLEKQSWRLDSADYFRLRRRSRNGAAPA